MRFTKNPIADRETTAAEVFPMNSSLRSVYLSIAAAFVLWFFIFAYPVGNFLDQADLFRPRFWPRWVSSPASRDEGSFYVQNQTSVGRDWFCSGSLRDLPGRKGGGKFPLFFRPGQIASVYATRTQRYCTDRAIPHVSHGAGGEIYWHGFVQRRFVERYGATVGVLGTAVVYALVTPP